MSKRNAMPQQVHVMSAKEFAAIESLDARAEAMVENRNEVVIHNIDHILKSRGITQAHMCNEDLEGSPQPPQLASYRKPKQDIPFRKVARIAAAYGYTPEQMYGQLLDRQAPDGMVPSTVPRRSEEEYDKYVGTYHMAYFCTDARLGHNSRTAARSVCNGMLSICRVSDPGGAPALRAIAFFNCTEEESEALSLTTEAAHRSGSPRALHTCYDKLASGVSEEGHAPRMKCFYEGVMLLSDHVNEISLRQVKGSDVVRICLHNRAAISSEGSAYRGGLATMMSISRGEEHMPCTQALILSRKGFAAISKEELADMLLLAPPKLEFHDEIRSIITYTRALFPSNDIDSPLSELAESDKAFMLESFIEKKLRQVIARNILSYYKISTQMDSDIYKAVCR